MHQDKLQRHQPYPKSHANRKHTRQKHYTLGEFDREIVQCHGSKTEENDKQRKRKPNSTEIGQTGMHNNSVV